jgi:hypothetical protein
MPLEIVVQVHRARTLHIVAFQSDSHSTCYLIQYQSPLRLMQAGSNLRTDMTW